MSEQWNCRAAARQSQSDSPTTLERKEYWRNGQLYLHVYYKNSRLEGERKTWHKNGQLCNKTYYKNGILEGEMKEWYENGRLFMHGYYKNGELDREFIDYDPNATLVAQIFWKEGIKITKKEYYDEILSLLDNKLDELHLKDIIFSFL